MLCNMVNAYNTNVFVVVLDEIAKRRHFRQKKEKCETRKLKKLQEEADKRLFGKCR